MRRTALALSLLPLVAGLSVTPAAAAPPTVITVGTSIEFGTGHQPGEAWPQRLALRAPDITFSDNSLPGGAWTAKNAEGLSIGDKVAEAVAEQPDVLIIGGPVNDLVRLADVGPLRYAVYDAVNAAKAAGIPTVVVMAIFPFNDGGAFQPGWWPNLEQRRTTYNTWAQQMYGPGGQAGTAYVDLTWALHETTTWRGDRRWFRDGLHFTRVGAALTAECFPLEVLGP